MHFYVMKKFCDFVTLRPSDLNTTLTYVLMDKFVLVTYIFFVKNYSISVKLRRFYAIILSFISDWQIYKITGSDL